MNDFLITLTIAAITGAGVITGLLFAFSNFIMRALAELPADKGMLAMQKINVRIINPLFIVFFMGTPLLCLIIASFSILSINQAGSLYLLIGSALYLTGPFGITVLFNVPLNNQLESTKSADAEQAWPAYIEKWQRWNHLRTYIAISSIVFMGLGLANT